MSNEIKEKKEYEVLKLILIVLAVIFIGLPLILVLLIFIVLISPVFGICFAINKYFNFRAEKIEINLKYKLQQDKLQKNYDLRSNKYGW